MKKILIALVCYLATQGWAATYILTASRYGYIVNYHNCTAGSCANYTNGMSVEGRIETSRRLEPNLDRADLNALITAYTISDGVTTYSSKDSTVRLENFASVWTDAQSNVTGFAMQFYKWQRPEGPRSLADRSDILMVAGTETIVYHNRHCAAFDAHFERCVNFPQTDSAASEARLYDVRLVEDVAPKVPVFRFYNATTQGHFFTASAAERDYVKSRMPSFADEGTAFFSQDKPLDGASPVFRFYNTASMAHFYTINADERDHVAATLPSYRYEGPAWYGFAKQAPGTTPVYRFYRARTNTHFYTVNQQEMEFVRDNDSSFTYEGIAYYAWDADR